MHALKVYVFDLDFSRWYKREGHTIIVNSK